MKNIKSIIWAIQIPLISVIMVYAIIYFVDVTSEDITIVATADATGDGFIVATANKPMPGLGKKRTGVLAGFAPRIDMFTGTEHEDCWERLTSLPVGAFEYAESVSPEFKDFLVEIEEGELIAWTAANYESGSVACVGYEKTSTVEPSDYIYSVLAGIRFAGGIADVLLKQDYENISFMSIMVTVNSMTMYQEICVYYSTDTGILTVVACSALSPLEANKLLDSLL